MSSQNNSSPTGNQRGDELPIVPTKAKLNHVLSAGSASDFGMDSMFQSTRRRQKLTDEDAPPTDSVNDIPHQVPMDTNPSQFQPRPSAFDSSNFPRRPQQSQPHTPSQQHPQSQQPFYVIVFGYPPDKYSLTAEYFRSFGGEWTEPDPNLEVSNCFRIGYKDAGDALRAVRKNGEVLGGSWMIGVKWADPAQAEVILGQLHTRNGSGAFSLSTSHSLSAELLQSMSVDPQSNSAPPSYPAAGTPSSNVGTPTFSTPIKLAPSTSAFKRSGSNKTSTPQGQAQGQTQVQRGPKMPGVSASASAPVIGSGSPATTGGMNAAVGTPNKSVLGQVSDLIFGW